MDIVEIILIFAVGIAAGFVNVVGGGGSLIALPALIFVGLPSAVANGTNRVALMVQSLVAMQYFRKSGYFYPKLSVMLAIPAVIGSVVGARFAISLTDEMFNTILAVVMIAVAVLVVWRPEKYFMQTENKTAGAAGEGSAAAQTGGKSVNGQSASANSDDELKGYGRVRLALAALAFFGVGFYGGFIQAGVGFIIIAVLALITGMSLVKINSLKVFVTAIYILSSLLIFVFSGNVHWLFGLVLAAGNAIGAYFGGVFTVKKGDKWIRVFLVVSVMVMAGKLLGVDTLLGL